MIPSQRAFVGGIPTFTSIPTTYQGAMVTVQDPATRAARILAWKGTSYADPTEFVPTLTGEVLQQATLTVLAGVSQRVLLPAGTYIRLTWFGYGPFAYRQGGSSVVATSADSPADVGPGGITQKTADYIAVYGIGAGTLVVEGGELA